MSKTIIHVNMHIIRRNLKLNDPANRKPPLTVRIGGATYQANEVAMMDDDGVIPASTVVYRPDDPLSCGARVWIETTNQVKYR